MTSKRLWIVAAIVFGLIAISTYFLQPPSPIPPEALKTPIVTPIVEKKVEESASSLVPMNHLVPEDPAKYGMVVVPSGLQAPKTVEDWEKVIRQGVEKNSTLDTPEAKDNLDHVKLTRQEYQEKQAKLDVSISKVQKALNDDPLNEDIKKRLERLYQIKAIGNILESKVVVE